MPSMNRIKRAWSEGRASFGVWATIPNAFAIDLLSCAGLDHVCVDQQHSIIDYASMVSMLQATQSAEITPVVRIAQNEPWLVMRVLDAGALGVIVPLVNNADDVKRAVSACRFPPEGTRSYGPIRASGVIGSSDPKILAQEVVCIAQIETREGLENVEEITATPGLDGVYIGPADLAISLDLPLEDAGENLKHVEAVERIREACDRNGIAAGLHTTSGEAARKYAEQGFSIVNVGVDYHLLSAAVNREACAARSWQ